MSSVIIAGDTSGTVTLQAPTAAGSTVINLPSTLGNTGTSSFATTDSSGNLGLGVTPSAWYTGYVASQVGVNGSVWANRTTADNNIVGIGTNQYLNAGASARNYISNGYACRYEQYNGGHYWFNAPSGTAGNAISFTQAMTLDASGNLGIGTTSPNGKFDILAGTGSAILVAADATNLVSINNYSTASGFQNLKFVGATLQFFTGTAGGGSASERARITSSGDFLVGTTTEGLSNSYSVTSSAASGGGRITVNHLSGAGSGYTYIQFGYNGSNIGSITQNGTTGVLYNLTSDYRLKNNPEALTGAKEFVMALQPKKWEWWDGSGEGVGFIAHEFMEVAKYSGNGEKDAVDENGNPVYQSIQPSSSEVMANLVALIQEQQAMITQLQADVAALKGA